MVIYYSGTGNSQYVAEAIAHRLDDEIVCTNTLMKKRRKGSFYSEKPYVFVFPVYLANIAEIFTKFLSVSSFKGCKEAYFVATGAHSMGAAPDTAFALCKVKGLRFMGASCIVMPQNYIALFTMTEEGECKKRWAEALHSANAISARVKNHIPLDLTLKGRAYHLMILFVEKLYNKYFTSAKRFYATDKCVGCHICENACPLNNVKLVDNKPVWSDSCIHCMACINHCPKKAIEYGKGTKCKPRYTCCRYQK